MTQTLTRRRALAAGGTAVAFALAGCSSATADGHSDGAETEDVEGGEDPRRRDDVEPGRLGNPASRVTVAARSIPEPALDPGLVHIEPGGTVEWRAEGVRNAATAYHPETHAPRRTPEGTDPWSSGVLREGDSFAVTLGQAGIYDYADTTVLCGTHEAYGTVGRIVVGWPELEGQPAIEADPGALPGRASTVVTEYNERCRTVLANR